MLLVTCGSLCTCRISSDLSNNPNSRGQSLSLSGATRHAGREGKVTPLLRSHSRWQGRNPTPGLAPETGSPLDQGRLTQDPGRGRTRHREVPLPTGDTDAEKGFRASAPLAFGAGLP